MITRNTTQAVVAVLGMTGLVVATLVTLFVGDLAQERLLLIGGLIGTTSGATAWLFRLNGNGKH